MTDVRELLQRQAEWQRQRKVMSWAEKVRIAGELRDGIAQLRRSWTRRPTRGSGRVDP